LLIQTLWISKRYKEVLLEIQLLTCHYHPVKESEKRMNSKALPRQVNNPEVGVYECEIHLKFRLIEEKSLLSDRDQLLQVLLDALTEGSDEFLETLQTSVKAHEVSELKASPQMRRQLMRLRNATDNIQ
jgi:Npun R1517